MNEEPAELNATTWEELNPDWIEQGDLTDRFAKSQFANCPGCGKFEQLKVFVASEDGDVAVFCGPCQFQANGDCPSQAIENWNRRVTDTEATR